MKFIVTAGGQGKKLWPYSTESKPKHFQNILDGRSSFQMAVETLLKAYSVDDVFISTKKRYVGIVLQQMPRLGVRNLIVEPDIAKNRGPAEGFAFVKLSILYPNEPFMIIQADNIRAPETAFLGMIASAEKLVIRDKKFISGGIKSTSPVLGVDYLRLGKQVQLDSNLEIFQVEEFLGRNDDFYKTRDLIQNFHVTVHSNHNCWYLDLILEAYKKYRPDWYGHLMQIKEVIGTTDEDLKISEIYAQMEPGATEEVTKNLWSEGYVILLPFKWTDIGTWGSLYDFLAKQGEVYSEGKIVAVNSKDSLIKSEDKQKLIATYGIDNLVVVDTKGVLLIIPKDQTEKISELLEEIRRKDLESYL